MYGERVRVVVQKEYGVYSERVRGVLVKISVRMARVWEGEGGKLRV